MSLFVQSTRGNSENCSIFVVGVVVVAMLEGKVSCVNFAGAVLRENGVQGGGELLASETEPRAVDSLRTGDGSSPEILEASWFGTATKTVYESKKDELDFFAVEGAGFNRFA